MNVTLLQRKSSLTYGTRTAKITVVIPANNEMNSIASVIERCAPYCDEVIVVDDGSRDETGRVSRNQGAKVIRNRMRLGIVRSTEIGLRAASGDIVVTLDADGQHDPAVIPMMIAPIAQRAADLVLGMRSERLPISERVLGKIVGLRVKCVDPGTGCRAMRGELARKIRLWGICLCGSLVLEAQTKGARITEVPIRIRPRKFGKSHWSAPLSRATVHFGQACLLIFHLARTAWPTSIIARSH